ncbi:MAG: hypothetical protein Q7J70_05020 [Thermodesulfovibrionales bacterium]|nr:hypothetical protein [Thermodesulfovibrionales bacterium]
MTGMPEASLARELAICFAGIGVVTNYAAGISDNRLTTTEVVRTMAESTEVAKTLLERTFVNIPHTRNCMCKDALANAKM